MLLKDACKSTAIQSMIDFYTMIVLYCVVLFVCVMYMCICIKL